MPNLKWFVILTFFYSTTKSQIEVDSKEDIDARYPLAPEHEDAPRIAGGIESQPRQFPFMVRIYIAKEGVAHRIFCGATLISPRYLLTAAHCLTDTPILIEARLGAYRPEQDEQTQVRINTTTFLVHPQFDPNAFQHDLAIVDLGQNVTLNENIQITRIAKGEETFAGHQGLTAGWGKTPYGKRSKVLRYTTNEILNNTYCNILNEGAIQDSHVCLGGEGHRGICNSDSGGPLVTLDGSTEIGIASFFDTECGDARSSVFTRVSNYYEWIKANSDIDY